MEDNIGQVMLGASNLETLSFIIRPGQAPVIERDTALHEMVHLLIQSSSLNDMLPKANEEGFVARFTPMLLMALRDNREMVAYLLCED